MITKEYFTKRKQQSFLVIEEMEGDEVTPVLLYQRLNGRKKCLLESSLRQENKGRYSFIGCNPYLEVTSCGEQITLAFQKKIEVRTGKVLEVIEEMLSFEHIESPFPFSGGAIGYIGYDVIRQYEEIGAENIDDINMPETHLLFYNTFLVYDHNNQTVYFVYVHRGGDDTTYEQVQHTLGCLKEQVMTSKTTTMPSVHVKPHFVSNVTKNEFCEMVEKAKEHILAGDLFQVVLSQRLQTSFIGDAFTLYRRLRITNPSPYMFYIEFGSYIVFGSSPESLVSVRGKRVMTNPIAGTRPRGNSEEHDAAQAKELLEDEKEKAEHIMLVDLGRNDLGFVCEIGTVAPGKYMEIEKYSHVMHIVSEVHGILREDMTCLDALRYCLPAGTVSGAPKIRAMEIINQLENRKRNVYAGTIGYISFTGDMDMALAIRTMIVKEQQAYIQAGAGIVYDSNPYAEYEETIHKANALLEVMK
ncbi:anthranilate synthase component I [Microbacteriaceae bacterium 4G12]